jgi:4a-hydroxytetrahydrobiopterin dehydratase
MEVIMALLNENEITQHIKAVNNWRFSENQIGKEFKFKDFKEALSFINKVGEFAEDMNHHPDILLHSYNKVKITLSSHDAGGVTEKDFKLAKKIESI